METGSVNINTLLSTKFCTLLAWKNSHQIPRTQVMTPSTTSTPWHAIFAFLIPSTGMIVQMHFPNSSPLDEHPASIWIFLICSLLYCFAVGCHIKCLICTPTDTTYLNRSVKVAFVSGSLAYTALISALVPGSFQPLVFIACLMLLFTYFNRDKIAEIGAKVVSYLYDLWTRIKGRASNMYDRWGRNDSGNVPVIIRSPV
ncbi:hypothetical protein K1719_001232 [Acacia pycnantha]|nr:hypothetical protein K1719_001232 [Acacia pycnantha]